MNKKNLPNPGDVIAGRYRIERKLGTGGVGTVFHSTHLQTERAVALKMVSPAFLPQGDWAKRIEREAKTSLLFDHPHIVEMLDYGVLPDGTVFLAMELLDGESLESRIARRLSLPEVVDIGKAILEALDHAHSAGVIHRDLKP